MSGTLPLFRLDPELSPLSQSSSSPCVNESEWTADYGFEQIQRDDITLDGFLFASALVFTDSNGSHGSLIPIPSSSKENVTQIMGCALSYEKQNVDVDVQTREMISPPTSFMKNESFWSLWKPTINLPGTASSYLNNGLPNSWPLIFMPDQYDWLNQSINCPILTNGNPLSPDAYCYPAVIPAQEQFILNYLPSYNSSSTSTYGNSLKDLENALANMVAAYYWTSLQMTPQNFPTSSSLSGNTTVMELTLKYRLKLNLTPVVFGLATSIMLTTLALFLTRGRSKESHGPISSLGVLQTIWLLNRYPNVSQTVASVEVPTLDNLRAAGMVSIQLDSFRQRRVNGQGSSTDGLADEDTIELGTGVPLLNTTDQ